MSSPVETRPPTLTLCGNNINNRCEKMEYINNRQWPTDRAKKAYDNGYFAEAIQTLHGWLESQSQEMLKLVGCRYFKTNLSDTWDITDEISLSNILKVLFVLGQITKEEYDKLIKKIKPLQLNGVGVDSKPEMFCNNDTCEVI